ncbi:DMT family transporter [Rhodovastum atsumiense]|uniref:DMT family transporter n=1 Tax=Rhodovastum atsumiense TaxID=504468 RepID=A0A5M6IKT3_9PROT|nr:DMT family transporter [Rhodovastum atsumiense]KAA5608876.1 DMT family transporter [Rhodovastum atsumiense]
MTHPAPPLAYAAGALAVLFWGATPAATALLARDMPSSLVGAARLLASAALLVPVVLVLRPRLPRDAGGWAALGISALVGFAASFVLQGLGIARTSTAHAALVLAAAPVITALLQFLLSWHRPRPVWWLGSALALSGVAVLILGRGLATAAGTASIAGDLIVFAGTVTVSIGYLAGARLSARIGLFAATAWSILAGALVMLPLLPALGSAVPALTPVGGAALGFLAAGCTVIGFAAWFWALDRGGVASIALLQFAQPVVSLLIAAAFLAEDVSPTLLLALGLILSGVSLCRRGR